MKTLIAVIAAALMSTSAATVVGMWSMTVDTPHGAMTTSLDLQQDGTKVTGTFSSAGHLPDMKVEGTFTDGVLKLGTIDGSEHKIVFAAKLLEDGTLRGDLSMDAGDDMNWTAKRAEAKEKR
jgi:hypothetical protein